MRWIGVWGVVLLSTSGCAAHECEVVAPLDVPSVRSTELVLGLVTHTDRGPEQNAFDIPLHTGDRVALILHIPEPRYLYLVNVAPDGSDTLLWPSDAPTRVERTVRLPDSGWYQLAAPPGLEMLGVVASHEPIALDSAGRARLFQMVHEADGRRDLVKLQSADPPGFASTGYASLGVRAPTLRLRDGSVRIDASAAETVVLIDMDHRPR